MSNCPRCDSPKPHLHPAVQFEGEVQTCTHDFHLTPTPQNTPKYIELVKRARERERRDMTDPIFVRCRHCDGYGATIIPSRGFHSKWDTDPPEYYNEEIPCLGCDGTCTEEIEGEPITLEDLEFQSFMEFGDDLPVLPQALR